MLDIHPSAQENINSKAGMLLSLLKIIQREPSLASSAVSEIPVTATITENEIIGEIQESSSDHAGRTTERYFQHNGNRVGLVSSDYQKLIALAESIQRIPSVRDRLSQDFIEEALFSWLKERYRGNFSEVPFMSNLQDAAKNNVKKITVFIPIASTVVEEPFEFCGITIQNISKSIIDEFVGDAKKVPAEYRDNVNKLFEDLRSEFQGRAAVKMQLECEPKYANDVGVEKARGITDLLGIYSRAVLIPDVKSVSKIKGTENIEQCTTITLMDSGGFQVTKQILDRASARHWMISKTDILEFRSCGLDILSSIYLKQNPSDFETAILNMSYLYSKAAFSSEPMAKLIYMLSALESTLLKNENEPIQQNLAERMAIFSAQELEKRKDIVKNVKAVYGLRSKYLHHGHSTNELEQIGRFFFNVWVFFVNLINSSNRFQTKEDFLAAIDDHKLS